MLFPKFTPLQSRCAASLAASLLLILLYLSFSNPHLAYAADADSIAHEDHNHPRLIELLHQSGFPDASLGSELEGEAYAPEFVGVDRSIIGRADATIRELGNNAPGQNTIEVGHADYWTFTNKTLWGPFSPQDPGLPPSNILVGLAKTQNSLPYTRKVYVSLNTCDQPHANNQSPNGAPSQLELYVSRKSTNQKPDRNANDEAVPVDGGYGEADLDVTSDIWFTVSAPQSPNFSGNYKYELTASIDAPYASYNDNSSFNLSFIDSDTNSALLYSSTVSENLTEAVRDGWMKNPPRFSIYVHPQDDPSINGLHRSVCGLKSHSLIQGNVKGSNVDTNMTLRGNGFPKQEFYVKNLNGSSAYYAIIGIDGNSTSSGGGVVGGGGTVWTVLNFTTKSDNNCKIIYNLPFCYQVAYAVPSNPNNTNLAAIYDNFAQEAYMNFNYSLQQIPCNTTSTAQYSLAVTCDDCAHAYRQWLCAVTIPRCDDFSSQKPYLQPRALAYPFLNGTNGTPPEFSDENKNRMATNQSRNWIIDSKVVPGPYKEVLPCIDLCYNLIQSCPAALGFACPLTTHGMNYSYGQGSEPFCNSLGTRQNVAGMIGVNFGGFLVALVVALGFIVGF